ncbi:MAG: peptide chain release factor N(5)-glutamine methyltransferase [Draconibacterium sp.]|nr:peptide chain release factor N(5)-glutamine methyltransferase [Draconibacterium sp.]
MNVTEVFSKINVELKDKLQFLDDKPEENLESTIKALWLAAAGLPVSAEKAGNVSLPELNEDQLKKLNKLIDFRLKNIPLAYITQRQSFMGIEFKADKRALIPRKETEILGKKALELSHIITKSKGNAIVFDVCCGAGNLGISISCLNTKCKVYASDISEEAVALTRENIELLTQNEQVKVFKSDLFSEFESNKFHGKIDLIVCNPPYISSAKVVKMNPEISSNEPVLAFDGGMLGVKIIQKLIADSPRFLAPQGWLVFEVGVGQGDFVIKLLQKTLIFQKINSTTDNSGNVRVVFAQKSPLLN